MNEFKLVKTDNFGEVQYDIYQNGDELYMTANQLCACLGESRSTFDSRISRNSKLKDYEFSVSCKMQGADGKLYNTRLFNEDGIYEITMLSESEFGDEFRAHVRRLLKAIRKGEITLSKPDKLKIQEKNANVRAANMFLKLSNVETLSKEYKNILVAKATEVLAGYPLIPLPQSEQKYYTATEIGDMFGVSNQKIGRLSNQFNMKTDEYGEWFRSKSQYSSREVDSFMYNDNAVERFREIIKNK